MARVRDVIQRDTRANQPLATAVDVGTLFYVTDESTTERSDGTNWQTYADAGGTSTDVAVSTTAANSFLTMGA